MRRLRQSYVCVEPKVSSSGEVHALLCWLPHWHNATLAHGTQCYRGREWKAGSQKVLTEGVALAEYW